MSDPPLLFWDHPNPQQAVAKAVWLQRREVMAGAALTCLRDFPVDEPKIAFFGRDEDLANALSLDLGIAVTPGLDEARAPAHVVVTELDPVLGHRERVDLLAQAFAWLRPAGKCVLVGTVVAPPGRNRGRMASAGQLVRELGLAWRESFHVDEFRSFRWLTEPFVRGLVLTITSLDVPPEPRR
jgi:hypothetical protein